MIGDTATGCRHCGQTSPVLGADTIMRLVTAKALPYEKLTA